MTGPTIDLGARWRETYPEALVGILAMDAVQNPGHHSQFDQRKRELEAELRDRYSSQDRVSLREDRVLAAYDAYYRGFGKTYHVRLQLESVAFKGKQIPSVSAVVEAMFMAELDDLLLTAGHDLDAIDGPLRIDAASGDEGYLRMNGQEQTLKVGDMMISDQSGVISCILYGPDKRTRIRPETENVLFTVYAPPGIERVDVHHHLEAIRDNVAMVSPDAAVSLLDVLGGT